MTNGGGLAQARHRHRRSGPGRTAGRALLGLGAKGYTLSEVRGSGARGVRAGQPDVNVKIEAVVSPEVADRILAHLAEHYFAHYAVIAYVETVAVVRGEKYT